MRGCVTLFVYDAAGNARPTPHETLRALRALRAYPAATPTSSPSSRPSPRPPRQHTQARQPAPPGGGGGGAFGHVCSTCGKGFAHPVSLVQHRQTHEGSTTCPVCQKVLNRKHDMKIHLAVKHGIQAVRQLSTPSANGGA